MSLGKSAKMINLLNYRLRITLSDSRVMTGQMLAFDKHMNLVLADCEEFRKIKPKKGSGQTGGLREEKRTLGLVILRGETVVSISVDGPPPPSLEDQKAKMAQMAGGPGIGRPAGRGLPVAPPGAIPSGIAGPVRGVGGPAPGMMQPRGPPVPTAAAAPMAYGRPPMPGMPPGMPGMPPGMMAPPRPGMPPMPGMPPQGFMGAPGAPPPGFRPPPGMPFPGAPPGYGQPGVRPPGPPPGMPPQ